MAHRILISFGSETYWLVRLVTYENGVPALQLVRVQGVTEARVSDNFNLTNDSINAVLPNDHFWLSLNSAMSEDARSEIVGDIPRTQRPLNQLPEAILTLVRRAIELELVKSL